MYLLWLWLGHGSTAIQAQPQTQEVTYVSYLHRYTALQKFLHTSVFSHFYTLTNYFYHQFEI